MCRTRELGWLRRVISTSRAARGRPQLRRNEEPGARGPSVRFASVLRLRGCRRARSRCHGRGWLGPLGLDQLAEDTPEVREGRIRQNRERLEAGVLIKGFLLALDDRLVLHEALDQALQERSRDGRVLTFEVVQVGPEKVRGALGLRRHVLAVAIFPGVLSLALLTALTGRCEH